MYFIAAEAVDDIDETVAFYLQGSRSVAVRFIDAVYSAIELLLINPYLGAAIGSGFRGFALKRYPFSMIYQVDRKRRKIMIYAFTHQSRPPGSWQHRVQEDPARYTVAA